MILNFDLKNVRYEVDKRFAVKRSAFDSLRSHHHFSVKSNKPFKSKPKSQFRESIAAVQKRAILLSSDLSMILSFKTAFSAVFGGKSEVVKLRDKIADLETLANLQDYQLEQNARLFAKLTYDNARLTAECDRLRRMVGVTE